jgi:hypothetical protein
MVACLPGGGPVSRGDAKCLPAGVATQSTVVAAGTASAVAIVTFAMPVSGPANSECGCEQRAVSLSGDFW